MADPVDIRTFSFPTLADPDVQDVLTAVDILRGRKDREGRDSRRSFTSEQRREFQSRSVAGNRLERVLAAIDAFAQENPATALSSLMPGPIGGIIGLAGLREMELSGRKPGDALREIAGAASGGRELTRSQAQTIQRRAEREDREANRALAEGRGSGAGPRRGAENAGNRGR